MKKPLPKLDAVKQLLLDQVFAKIRELPIEQQLDATLTVASVFASEMKTRDLLEVRSEAVERWSNIPEFIDLIDGQLALRSMQARSS